MPKSCEPSFWEKIDSFVLLPYVCLAASRTLLQGLLNCLNSTLGSEDLFCCYTQKKWLIWAITTAQGTKNHGDEWGLTWYLQCRIYTSIPSCAHSQNSLAAAEAPSLKRHPPMEQLYFVLALPLSCYKLCFIFKICWKTTWSSLYCYLWVLDIPFQLLPFGCPKANYGPFSRGQPHWANVNHCLFLIKKNNFMAPFYGWGSTASRLQPLRGGSLLFIIQFPEIPDTHFIDLGRLKGWVNLGATQRFWTQDPWTWNDLKVTKSPVIRLGP